MRRQLLVLAACAAVSACTPAQIRAWQAWHTTDPEAAIAFANQPHIQEELAHQAQPETNVQRGDVWDRIAECESGQTWSYNGGSGYDGGLQFLPSTWRSYGGREFAEYAYQASREQQITVANRVLEDVGWIAWPNMQQEAGAEVTEEIVGADVDRRFNEASHIGTNKLWYRTHSTPHPMRWRWIPTSIATSTTVASWSFTARLTDAGLCCL